MARTSIYRYRTLGINLKPIKDTMYLLVIIYPLSLGAL